jgi:hypothetical protein
MLRRAKTATLTARRDASLDAVPRKLPSVRTELHEGRLRVTIKMRRPRWQQILGGDATLERTFGLDKYGQKVYEACDGSLSVRHIIRLFAHDTKVSQPEAETAVTKFLHTLLAKGLVAIEMEKPNR